MRCFNVISRAAVALCLSAMACAAQDYVTDAFGVFDAGQENGTRGAWAGVQVHIGQDGERFAEVEPQALDRLVAFNGPKSLVAGRDRGQFVVLALDALGNTVGDGTKVSFRLGAASPGQAGTQRGIGSYWYDPGTKAGLFHAGAFAGQRQSARTEYRVVPDLSTAQISGEAAANLLPDGIARLNSSILTDALGNQLSDGTFVQLSLAQGSAALNLIPATTILGQGVARFQTLGMPQDLTGKWTLGTVASGSFPVTVAPLALTGKLELRARDLPGIAGVAVTLGPFRSEAGYHLNDGTEVQLTVMSGTQEGVKLDGWLSDGLVTFVLPVASGDLPVIARVEGRFGGQSISLRSEDLLPEAGQ